MKLKSYFSGTVEAAMELARQELGEEALLVNARPATPETRYLGAYEVVFGVPPPHQRTLPAPAAGDSAEAAGNDRLALEVAGLKREFERMMRSLAEAQSPAPPVPQPQPIPQPQPEVTAPPSYAVDPTLGRHGASRAIVTLVGPAGAGKTTSLIKLAARFGLTGRKPPRILSTDVHRIAAADQLRSLASILGIDCDIAETAGALAQILEEHRSKDLLFLDTPGLGPAEMDDALDLAMFLVSHPETDVHLVLPAFMRAADMDRSIEQYSIFAPRKLLFTHLDETAHHRDLAMVAARHHLPISFLGTGQQIPDDLEPAETARIDALAGIPPRPARSAAQTKGAAA